MHAVPTATATATATDLRQELGRLERETSRLRRRIATGQALPTETMLLEATERTQAATAQALFSATASDAAHHCAPPMIARGPQVIPGATIMVMPC